MVAKTITKKKNSEIVNEELLNLLRESDAVEEQEFNIKNITNQREVTDITKPYEKNIKTENKKNDKI